MKLVRDGVFRFGSCRVGFFVFVVVYFIVVVVSIFNLRFECRELVF